MFGIFSKKDRCPTGVFWWRPDDGTLNAGDHLASIIVQQMLMLIDKSVAEKKNVRNTLFSIGSVMHFARNGDTIWGTGINGKISEAQLKFTSLDVRAVRGPLTREFLLARDIHVPNIFGDPGLLLPSFFSRDVLLNFEEPDKDFIIIPHMNENMDTYSKWAEHLCSPRQGALAFTRQIVRSRFVISGSLHGLIIAEAYGIPAVFIDNNSGESRFKYSDYYSGTGRSSFPVARTVQEALSISPVALPDIAAITRSLRDSFPFDLWL